jgi:hypothetical protein
MANQEALKLRPSAAPDHGRRTDAVKYRVSVEVAKATKRAERAAQREPNNYVPACDAIAWCVCRKGVREKAPWNRRNP